MYLSDVLLKPILLNTYAHVVPMPLEQGVLFGLR
jgi:hypothetical protein